MPAQVGSPKTSTGSQPASHTTIQPERTEDRVFSINTELIIAKLYFEKFNLQEYQKCPAEHGFTNFCVLALWFPSSSSKRTKLLDVVDSVISNLSSHQLQCITNLYFIFLDSFKSNQFVYFKQKISVSHLSFWTFFIQLFNHLSKHLLSNLPHSRHREYKDG